MSGLASCTCASCVRACKTAPGWMTPAEAKSAIDAGKARRLMRDWLEPCSEVGNEERIYVLSPAAKGYESADAREFSFSELMLMAIGGPINKGRCIFLKNNRCEIHSSGFKPRQCRETLACGQSSGPSNYVMARLWNTKRAKALVDKWATLVSERAAP